MPSLHELRQRLSGLVAPIVTPFDDNGAVSLSGLRHVLEFVADAGVAAVIPGDLVGEFFSLTLEERRLLLQESVNVAGSRIVVIALTADASLDNAIALAQFAQRAGADVIKLALPYPYRRRDGREDLRGLARGPSNGVFCTGACSTTPVRKPSLPCVPNRTVTNT